MSPALRWQRHPCVSPPQACRPLTSPPVSHRHPQSNPQTPAAAAWPPVSAGPPNAPPGSRVERVSRLKVSQGAWGRRPRGRGDGARLWESLRHPPPEGRRAPGGAKLSETPAVCALLSAGGRGGGGARCRGPTDRAGLAGSERLRARGAGLGPTAGFGGRLCARIKPRRVEQETRLFSETPQHPVTLRVLWVTALSCVGQGLRLPSPTGEDLGLCR